MTKLVDIEGVGETQAKKLQEAGIKSLESLLKNGATVAGRKKIVKDTGISAKLILKWVNRADLVRIKGIGEEYADLLEMAGVDTVPELAKRKPANLYAKMAEVNQAKKLVRKLPAEKQVADWVAQAKKLPRVIKY